MKLFLVLFVCSFVSIYSAPVVENESRANSVIEASSEEPNSNEINAASEENQEAAASSTNAPTESQSTIANEQTQENDSSTDETASEAASTESPTTEQPQSEETATTEVNEEGSDLSNDIPAETNINEVKADAPPSTLVTTCDISTNNEARQESKVEEVKVPAVESRSSRSGRRGSVKYSDTKLSNYENDVSFDGNYRYR